MKWNGHGKSNKHTIIFTDIIHGRKEDAKQGKQEGQFWITLVRKTTCVEGAKAETVVQHMIVNSMITPLLDERGAALDSYSKDVLLIAVAALGTVAAVSFRPVLIKSLTSRQGFVFTI